MKKLISLLAILLLAAGDQAIKLLVVENLKPVGSVSVIPGFLDFTYVENRGVAFGMFSGMRWLVVKNTSSWLLESFRRQTVTDEDVCYIQRYTTVYLE